jgi:hypothetical protein
MKAGCWVGEVAVEMQGKGCGLAGAAPSRRFQWEGEVPSEPRDLVFGLAGDPTSYGAGATHKVRFLKRGGRRVSGRKDRAVDWRGRRWA